VAAVLDVRLFQVLYQRAMDALATVKLALQSEGVGQVDLIPHWHFSQHVPPGLGRVRFVDSEGWELLHDNRRMEPPTFRFSGCLSSREHLPMKDSNSPVHAHRRC
jgi:hypothetical protein